MLIVPKGVETPKTSNELTIDDKKKAEMVAKAKELMNNKSIEPCDLTDLLEQEYVKNKEHYMSKQLKSIIDQVKIDLTPEPTEELEEIK